MNSSPPVGRTVWVAGATGLVGRAVVDALANDPMVARIVALVRRPLDRAPASVESRIVAFDALETSLADERADIAICCLGTTIRQAGSQAAFRRVDFDYVLAFARAAKAAGVRHFLVVTALGASPTSLGFYNRVKGEVEEALANVGFDALTIVRPSLLLGERTEMRIAERLAAPLSRFLPIGVRGIEGDTVARAIVRLAAEPARGKRVVPSSELQSLGR